MKKLLILPIILLFAQMCPGGAPGDVGEGIALIDTSTTQETVQVRMKAASYDTFSVTGMLFEVQYDTTDIQITHIQSQQGLLDTAYYEQDRIVIALIDTVAYSTGELLTMTVTALRQEDYTTRIDLNGVYNDGTLEIVTAGAFVSFYRSPLADLNQDGVEDMQDVRLGLFYLVSFYGQYNLLEDWLFARLDRDQDNQITPNDVTELLRGI